MPIFFWPKKYTQTVATEFVTISSGGGRTGTSTRIEYNVTSFAIPEADSTAADMSYVSLKYVPDTVITTLGTTLVSMAWE